MERLEFCKGVKGQASLPLPNILISLTLLQAPPEPQQATPSHPPHTIPTTTTDHQRRSTRRSKDRDHHEVGVVKPPHLSKQEGCPIQKRNGQDSRVHYTLFFLLCQRWWWWEWTEGWKGHGAEARGGMGWARGGRGEDGGSVGGAETR